MIALILNDIQPLSKNNLEMFLALKDNASKLLLAVMESNDDTANAERILYNITPKSLIDVIREAYEQGKEMDRQAELEKQDKKQQRQQFQQRAIASMDADGKTVQPGDPSQPTQSDQQPSEAAQSTETTTSGGNEDPKPADDTSSTSSTQKLIPASSDSDQPKSQHQLESSESIETEPASEADSGEGDDKNSSSGDSNKSEDSEGASPREVGHNLYILAHKLAKFNKELSILLKSKDSQENEALAYYAAHTAQIEVSKQPANRKNIATVP